MVPDTSVRTSVRTGTGKPASAKMLGFAFWTKISERNLCHAKISSIKIRTHVRVGFLSNDSGNRTNSTLNRRVGIDREPHGMKLLSTAIDEHETLDVLVVVREAYRTKVRDVSC